jgi:uncharacterized OsmC-like protein
MYTAKIKTLGETMARSTTEVRSFKIFMDEPPELGGQDGAPSPLEFILAAQGGCLSYMTFYIGKELGIDVKGTEVEIEASLDPAKFAGTNRDVRAGYQAVHVKIRVDADATPEELEKLRAEVEARCPVSDNIAHGTPVHVSLTAPVSAALAA